MLLWKKLYNVELRGNTKVRKNDTLVADAGSTITANGTLNAAGTLQMAGTTVTATASELNTSVAGLTATTAEINKAADVSTRIVNTTATALAITAAAHGGRIVKVSSAAPLAVTLPAATGSGEIYSFVIAVAATATGHTIKVANTADIMAGVSIIAQTDTAQVNGFLSTATDDTITINGTTKAGKVGDEIRIVDVASGVFSVRLLGGASGTVVTPFSASV